MIDAAILWLGLIALPWCGLIAARRMCAREARAYGRAQHVAELYAAGARPTDTIQDARRIARARRKGKQIVRTWRKVEIR